MKTFLTMSALAGTAAAAQSDDHARTPVSVYIQHNARGTLSLAQALARQMFTSANADPKWRIGAPESQDIVVEITSRTATNLNPGALASAEPFEGVHITVFYDRVEAMSGYRLAPWARAHVLVHEITHILEGMEHHSRTGVTKAHWNDRDVAGMAREALPSDPADLYLIRLGLIRRHRALTSDVVQFSDRVRVGGN